MKKQKTARSALSDLIIDPDTLNALEAAQAHFNQLQKDFSSVFEMIKSVKPLVDLIKPIRDWYQPVMEAHLSIQSYLESRKQMATGIAVFPEHGWYLSTEYADTLDSTKLKKFFSLAEKEWNDEMEEMFAGSFEGNFPDIKARVIETSTKRTHILQQIFDLHEAGNYIASIPLALIQADGVCKDNFFVMKNGSKRPIGFFETDRPVDGISGQKIAKNTLVTEPSIFNFVSNQLAAKDRNKHPLLEKNTMDLSGLNRHAILHGESLDYGTKVNSMKSILLLDFVTELVLVNRYLTFEKEKGQIDSV